jgi:hypothetical protein
MEYGPRTIVNAVIPNGDSVSNALEFNNSGMVGFVAPAAWTAAALNIEVSVDNTNWVTAGIFDSASAAIGTWSSVTAGAGYTVDIVNMLPWRFIRLRSGTAGIPVNQGAARTFNVISRALA